MAIAREIAHLCDDCACSIYGTRAPSAAYADCVSRLLFMTAAHESCGFKHRRQLGFNKADGRGAFGLFQCEWASIEDSIKYVRQPRRAELYGRCVTWLDGYDRHFPELNLTTAAKLGILAVIQERRGDPLACLLARLHYLRNPEPVPSTPQEQAAYAKRVYNTHLGAATAADYLRAYERYWTE